MKKNTNNSKGYQYDVKRGDIYFINLGGAENIGSEQKGLRPCLVVQNDTGNQFSSTTIVAPITSKVKNNIPTHVKITLRSPSVILCEQLRTVSKNRIVDYVTTVDDETMEKVEKAMMIALGLM